MAGIRRRFGTRPDKVDPLTTAQRVQMIATLDLETLAGLRDGEAILQHRFLRRIDGRCRSTAPRNHHRREEVPPTATSLHLENDLALVVEQTMKPVDAQNF